MMKHIGIVACSAEGAALCYRTIAQAAEHYLGDYNHPTVTMHSIAMAEWMPAFNAGDYRKVIKQTGHHTANIRKMIRFFFSFMRR